MCGIVGFAGFDDADLLTRMSAAVTHRGPDDNGRYRSVEHGVTRNLPDVCLAARRLSIMDVADGHQPMLSDSAAVVFNGEIYNHAELAEELSKSGAPLRTRCDTEILLRGYEVWGWHSLVEKLNGMFAFAIHDRRNGELRIARDRTGQKPLYYSRIGGQIIFASEIKALLQSLDVTREINYPAIDRYLALRYVPQPETLLKNVAVLPGGHHLCWRDGKLDLHQYWSPPIVDETTADPNQLLEEFTELYDAAIRRTLRSDVPVGTYLSAGVDSSLITATLANHSAGESPFSRDAFSLGFGSPIDETNQAAELAGQLGLQHHIYELKAADLDGLSRALWHLERPIAEPLILAYDRLSRGAAEKVKVVFSGEGADELFAGYSFHRVLQRFQRHAKPPMFAGTILRMMPVALLNRMFSFPAYLGKSGKRRLVSFVDQYANRNLGQNYAALRSLFEPLQRRGLYSDNYKHQATEDWIHSPHAADAANGGTARPLERLLNLQYHDWLQDFALLRQDKLSMAHGLEVRLPFLDNTLIDFAAKLPADCKLAGRTNKVLLRQLAAKRLPPTNAKRKKQAFYFPLETFYREPAFQELVQSTLNPAAVAARGIFDPSAITQLRKKASTGEFLILKQIMALVMLELWMKMFVDGTEL